jgi:hypothetical protein
MVVHGEITATQAGIAQARLLGEAQATAGRNISIDELLTLEVPAPTAAEVQQLTALQKVAGLITAVNILWIVGGVLVFAAIVLLFGWFLRKISAVFWEVILYGVSGALLSWSHTLATGIAENIAFTGALFLAGALGFSWFRHKLGGKEHGEVSYCAVTAAILGALAVVLGNSAIGFVAVMAAMGALGFSVAVIPFGYAVGFKDEDAVARGTGAALVILIGFVALRALGHHIPAIAVFTEGAYWMGAFVGYLGLLILASKWYARRGNYAAMQVVMIVAGIAAIVVGSVLQIGELQKIGGTFFALWGIEKLTEIPVASKEGVGVLCLFLAGVLTAVAWTVKANAATFAPYILGL